MADGFDDHDGHEQDDEDHTKAVVLTPADLFIHNKAQAACAHIPKDRGVADVALQAEQRHGQIRGQDLWEHSGSECAKPGRAQGLHGLIGAHIHRLDDLKELLAHIGKGEHRNGTRTGHRAEAENVCGDQGAYQRGQRAHQAEKQAHDEHHRTVGDDVAGGGNGKGNGQHRAHERAQEGHLDGVPQGLPDLGQIPGVGREHSRENVKKLAAFFHQHRKVEAGDMHRQRTQRQHDQNDQRRAAALFLYHCTIGQRIAAGLEQAVIQAHTLASAGLSSP